jgi:digeranylgeranylglycerophospholipid reductase
MKTDHSFDAVVIGAGPAGSLAAYQIARAGFSVLLVEKHPVVGVPVCCAEGITVEGLTKVVPLDRRWVCSDISRITLHGPDGTAVAINHPAAGYILDRTIFDRDLAARAAAAGATLWVNAEAVGIVSADGQLFDRVIVSRGGRTESIGCRIIIGCDGVESLVGRWAGMDTLLLPENMDSAAQILLGDLRGLDQHQMEFFILPELAPGGYVWVFPKSPTTANVGLGYTPSLGDGRTALARLKSFVDVRYSSASKLATNCGGIPAFRGRKIMTNKNVLLAGDAARLLDSLSGAGIANALLSGKYAGQTAAEYLNAGAPRLAMLRQYPERFMRDKGRNLRYLLYARQIFMKMSTQDFNDVVVFLKSVFDGKTIHEVDAVSIIKSILRAKPRLLTLARHLFW